MANVALHKGDRGSLVIWLQDALNRKHGTDLLLDGDYGRITETAVREFQRAQGLGVDGSAGKNTLQALGLDLGKARKNGEWKSVAWQLPSRSDSFVTYNRDGNDQFGTEDTIARFMTYLDTHFAKSGIVVEVGNISRYYGGRHRPHQSHRNGQQVDIRPLRGDGKTGDPLTFRSAAYSREATQEFVDIVRKDSPGVQILFNDPQIRGVKRFSGHDNHLHFSFSRVTPKYRIGDAHRAAIIADSPL